MKARDLAIVAALGALLWVNRHSLGVLAYRAGEAVEDSTGYQNPVQTPGGPADPRFGAGNPYAGDPIWDPYDPLGYLTGDMSSGYSSGTARGFFG